MPGTDALAEGEAALRRGDWQSARSSFATVLAAAAPDTRESAEALYGLARSVEWSADYPAAVELYRRAFAALRAQGEVRRPAMIAGRELAFLYAAVHGDLAVTAGWMARAVSLAAQAGDCAERGWISLAEALLTDDPEQKEGHVRTATRLARRFGDTDLVLCARAYEGLCLVLRGRVVEGMRCVDESVAAASAGEVRDYLATGEIYCKMLLCCELALDVRRAQQWVEVATSFGSRESSPWVSAICRMHYGGILTAAGRWAEAERELTAAIELYDAGYRAMRSGAVVRLADLRLRQGRLEEAARLLTGMEFDSYAARPLARLHLVRGELETAADVLQRFLEGAGEGVLQAPELALLAEVMATAGRLNEAEAVAGRLQGMASQTELPHVRGFASYASGVVSSRAGDQRARQYLEHARAAFAAAGLPLDEARARLALAHSLAGSRPELATAEARTALQTCRRLDARADADAAVGLLRRLGHRDGASSRSRGPLTRRESEVLDLVLEGLSNERIAARLYISKRTVEHHVSNILAKRGLSTRTELLARATRPS